MDIDSVKGFVKDLLSTLIIVAVILGVGFAITGTYPFMVAVESGSMIPNMYRGDVIFLMSPDRTDIVTYAEGMKTGYTSFGDYGDVIVYRPNGDANKTPIIHRAMGWIEKGSPMPNGLPAPHAGYITKGDHNPIADQPTLTEPVKHEWVVGVAKLRVPAIGHLSLLFRG